MKYIFLDIDGVLWTVGWAIYCDRVDKGTSRDTREWDMIQTSNLQWVVDKAKEQGVDVKIVISSTWRLGRTIEELQDIALRSGLDPSLIVGKTPAIYYKIPYKVWYRQCWGPWYKRIIPRRSTRHEAERGDEIQHWMNENNVLAKDIVIIDDDSDMVHLKHRLVKTCAYDGLGHKGACKVAKYLGLKGF